MRPLRILYLMDALRQGEEAGGTEAQFGHLMAHLDRRRFDPHLAVFRATRYMERLSALECPVSVLHIDSLARPAAAWKLLRLAAFVRDGGFDLVHIFFTDASIAGPAFCRAAGARVIVSRRDMGFWYTRATLGALRVSNLFVDRMIANSEAVRQNVHQRERYPLDRTVVCCNGHDPARFQTTPLPGFRARLGLAETDPVVGMVANFNPWKRHLDLIRAFAQVRRRHSRAHLVLVGGGPTEESRTEAARLGLAEVVHFLGPVADVVPVLHHFDVAVLCSESEGSSNAVIEYLACGKPVVCTNVGGNAELVREGETGFLLDPGNVPALADGISRLLEDRRLREQMGTRARGVAARMTIKQMADSHMSLYTQLAARPLAS